MTVSANPPSHSERARSDGAEIVARLTAMIPALRARGQDAEREGRIPADTIDELLAADVFRAVVPARFGGHEVEFRHIPRIFREIGKGCVSTAWAMGFLVYHNFQFAHFPEEAQQEVWGRGRGFTMAPGQVMPSGRAEAVEGGFRLSGHWGYATGILHGDWMLVSAPVVNAETPNEIYRFYVPVSEFRVHDTWHVAAMRATGSHDVELENAFVPAYRSVTVRELRSGASAGLTNNSGPLWRIPLLTFMSLGAVGPMVGAAEAMFEIVTGSLKSKVRAYSTERAQQQMSTRVRLARIGARLAAMTALYESTINQVEAIAGQGLASSQQERAETRAFVSFIASEARALVNELALEAGSRANYLDSPVQRFQRDVNALATHALFDFDHTGDLYGQCLLDMNLPAGAMV